MTEYLDLCKQRQSHLNENSQCVWRFQYSTKPRTRIDCTDHQAGPAKEMGLTEMYLEKRGGGFQIQCNMEELIQLSALYFESGTKGIGLI